MLLCPDNRSLYRLMTHDTDISYGPAPYSASHIASIAASFRHHHSIYFPFSASASKQSCLFTAILTLYPPSPIPIQAPPTLLAPAPRNAQVTQSFNHAAPTTITPTLHPKNFRPARCPMDSPPTLSLQAPPRSCPPMTEKRPPTLHSTQSYLPPLPPRQKRRQSTAHQPAKPTSSTKKKAVSHSTGATTISTLQARATDAKRLAAAADPLERAC